MIMSSGRRFAPEPAESGGCGEETIREREAKAVPVLAAGEDRSLLLAAAIFLAAAFVVMVLVVGRQPPPI